MNDYELVTAFLRKAIAATDDPALKLRFQEKLDRITNGFRAPGGCGDKVKIAVQRKES